MSYEFITVEQKGRVGVITPVFDWEISRVS